MQVTEHPVALPQAEPDIRVGTRLDHFDRVTLHRTWGRQLRDVDQAAAALKRDFVDTGKPDTVSTHDLIGLPYPTNFGLWRAHLTPAPFLQITNRMMVVRWTESDGQRRTLLFEPTDPELAERTPYFAALAKPPAGFIRPVTVTRHSDVRTELDRLGIAPEEVDYIAFDHLHTQDVRRWLGTTAPQADLSPDRPVQAQLPNARLLVQREELEAMADLHPLQRPWYQPATYADLPPHKLVPLDGDVLLGPGVALLSTPGHTHGNQTLLLHTDSGVWATSENGIAAESYTPEHSRIPGMRGKAAEWGRDVVLNANTIESAGQQYNSMMKEKALVDRSARDERFLQFFPSSELTAALWSPGTKPTFTHGGIWHGVAGR